MAIQSLKGFLVTSVIFYLFGVALVKIYLFLASKGLGVTFFNHFPGKCRVIPDIECGSEDIAVTKDGLAFISNGFRGLTGCDVKKIKGNIYLFDFKNPNANVTKLQLISDTIDFSKFEPVGLSIWEENDGETLLFVVDYGVSERVQVFEYQRNDPEKLRHKETIINENFICINDLVATGKRSFYITNYLKYCQVSKIALALESQLALATGSVVFYNDTYSEIIADRLKMPNGINLSPGGRFLYVATSGGESLLIYNRNKENDSIELVREIPLHAAADNIEVDRDTGDLYIGVHRSYRALLADYNGSYAAPAHILRVRSADQNWNKFTVTEILGSDGMNFIRGSSVGSFYKGGLLVGTVYHRLAYCENDKIL